MDKFDGYADSLSSPFVEHAFDVTPSDTADLPQVTKYLYAETAGDIRVTLKSGATLTLTTEANTGQPFRVKRVWATGTTATGIKGLV